MSTGSGMTPEYARFIAGLFQRVQAKGAEIRRERQETSGSDASYLECYEAGLVNALLLMKTQAQIFGFDLGSLGMAALDPKRKGWFESVFEPMHLVDTANTASGDEEDDVMFSPAEYLQIVSKRLREFARDVRARLAQGDAVADKAHAQALDDTVDLLEEARVRAGLDEQFAVQK